MRCPICGLTHSIQVVNPFYVIGGVPKLVWVEAPLYQRSYPREPKYISPRCLQCFDKAVKRKDHPVTRLVGGECPKSH